MSPCECMDKGCPIHKGQTCTSYRGKVILHRVDMEDISGTMFCLPCSNDAMGSGLFRIEE